MNVAERFSPKIHFYKTKSRHHRPAHNQICLSCLCVRIIDMFSLARSSKVDDLCNSQPSDRKCNFKLDLIFIRNEFLQFLKFNKNGKEAETKKQTEKKSKTTITLW